VTTTAAAKHVPVSIRESKPNDFGGIVARTGFAYQDHVAAQCCLDMLFDEQLSEVWCETFDDIVLIRSGSSEELVEFVQVKCENLNQLYSASVLCDGDTGKSLFERSLTRDVVKENASFRIVSSSEINAELAVLKLPRDAGVRQHEKTRLDSLCKAIRKKNCGGCKSLNGHDVEYWVAQCIWQVSSEAALVAENKLRLTELLEKLGLPVYVDTAQDIYQRLLWRVKRAAEADFASERSTKILKASELREWLKAQVSSSPTVGSNSVLTQKIKAAAGATSLAENAVEMRVHVNQEFRQQAYLNLQDSRFIFESVHGVLHQLQAKLDSGEISIEGAAFHSLCIDRVIAVKQQCTHMTKPPTEAFLLGCMYEIVSRCRHRFVRPRI
jgi:hypothetical protein